MDITVNRTKIMQKVNVENALILIGLRTGTYMFVELFHVQTIMHNSLFINNMYVTLLSSTCFEH